MLRVTASRDYSTYAAVTDFFGAETSVSETRTLLLILIMEIYAKRRESLGDRRKGTQVALSRIFPACEAQRFSKQELGRFLGHGRQERHPCRVTHEGIVPMCLVFSGIILSNHTNYLLQSGRGRTPRDGDLCAIFLRAGYETSPKSL